MLLLTKGVSAARQTFNATRRNLGGCLYTVPAFAFMNSTTRGGDILPTGGVQIVARNRNGRPGSNTQAGPAVRRRAAGSDDTAKRRRLTEPPLPIVRGVLGILRQRGRLLMIRRAADVRIGGVWCFPGGAIETGESEEAALVREMNEELGLMVAPIERACTLRKRAGRLVLFCWTAHITGGELTPNPAEVSDARWVTPRVLRTWPITRVAMPDGGAPHLIAGSLTILNRLGL